MLLVELRLVPLLEQLHQFAKTCIGLHHHLVSAHMQLQTHVGVALQEVTAHAHEAQPSRPPLQNQSSNVYGPLHTGLLAASAGAGPVAKPPTMPPGPSTASKPLQHVLSMPQPQVCSNARLAHGPVYALAVHLKHVCQLEL